MNNFFLSKKKTPMLPSIIPRSNKSSNNCKNILQILGKSANVQFRQCFIVCQIFSNIFSFWGSGHHLISCLHTFILCSSRRGMIRFYKITRTGWVFDLVVKILLEAFMYYIRALALQYWLHA